MFLKTTDIEDTKNDATVKFIGLYQGLVSIFERHKTELTYIEAMYIEDSLYSFFVTFLTISLSQYYLDIFYDIRYLSVFRPAFVYMIPIIDASGVRVDNVGNFLVVKHVGPGAPMIDCVHQFQ